MATPAFNRQTSTQLDEISALQSILEDRFMVLQDAVPENDAGPVYQLKVSLLLPSESIDFHEQKLHHLLPITLKTWIPIGYPRSTMPRFQLSCVWLTDNQLLQLAQHLTDAWDRCVGEVVVFQWYNLLQDAWLVLGLQDPLVLTIVEAGSIVNAPCIAASLRATSEDDIQVVSQTLIDWNEEELDRIWRRDFHNCDICLNEIEGSKCIRLSSCGHSFCRECLSGFVTTQISDGNPAIPNLGCNCPSNEGCGVAMLPSDLRALVSAEIYDRYERLLFQKSLESMNDIVYCPIRRCQAPVIVDSKQPSFGHCSVCAYAFCVHCKKLFHERHPCTCQYCGKAYHEGKVCNDDKIGTVFKNVSNLQRLDLIRDFGREGFVSVALELYLDADAKQRAWLQSVFGSVFDVTTLMMMRNLEWITRETRPCPKCSVPIEKNGGCNHMYCSKCFLRFCWKCMRPSPCRC